MPNFMYGVICDWHLASFYQSKTEADERAKALVEERKGEPYDQNLGKGKLGRIWVYRLQLMTNNKGKYSYEYDGTDAEWR